MKTKAVHLSSRKLSFMEILSLRNMIRTRLSINPSKVNIYKQYIATSGLNLVVLESKHGTSVVKLNFCIGRVSFYELSQLHLWGIPHRVFKNGTSISIHLETESMFNLVSDELSLIRTIAKEKETEYLSRLCTLNLSNCVAF